MRSFNGVTGCLVLTLVLVAACGVGEDEGSSDVERETTATRVSNATCENNGVTCAAPDYCEKYWSWGYKYRCMSGDPEVTFEGCARHNGDEGCDDDEVCVRYDVEQDGQGTVQKGTCKAKGCVGVPGACDAGFTCRAESKDLKAWVDHHYITVATYRTGSCIKTSWTTKYYGCMRPTTASSSVTRTPPNTRTRTATSVSTASRAPRTTTATRCTECAAPAPPPRTRSARTTTSAAAASGAWPSCTSTAPCLAPTRWVSANNTAAPPRRRGSLPLHPSSSSLP